MTKKDGSMLGHMVTKAMDAAGGLMGQLDAITTETAVKFVERAGISDLYEIESSRLAETRARSPELKEAARQMIEDHTRSSTMLKAATPASMASALPIALDARRRRMIDHLYEAPEDRFDRTYLDQQVLAHQEAVVLMHHYRDKGDDAELRAFAAEVSPMIEQHLVMMKNMRLV
jgi:putative membrane protein